jgi:hypothetical protein
MPRKHEDSTEHVTPIVFCLTGIHSNQQAHLNPNPKIAAEYGLVANMEEHILDAVAARPGTSTRRLALQQDVSYPTVRRILRVQQLYPYHVQQVQFLQPGDHKVTKSTHYVLR